MSAESENKLTGEPCRKLQIPPDVCHVSFTDAASASSDDLGLRTARGEMMIFDFDEQGRVVGIELVGSGKPCQF